MGPDAGDGRHSASLSLGPPAPGPRAPGPRAPGPVEPGSATRARQAHCPTPMQQLAYRPPTFAAGPNQPVPAARPRARRRAAYRGSRRDGRLMAVRGDGAAYRHVMSGKESGDSATGHAVDGGTTRDTDVDKRIRARPQDAGSSPERAVGPIRASRDEPPRPDRCPEPGRASRRYPSGGLRRRR